MDLQTGNATFGGLISGGEIRIGTLPNGQPAFHVDPLGNVRIARGSIDIGNGNFTVNSAGHVEMWSADIRGGRLRLGSTDITESMFHTLNGDYCEFFNSRFGPTNNIHGDAVILGTLNANRILANSITANEIMVRTITADLIGAGELHADVVLSSFIRGNQINVDDILVVGNRIEVGDQSNDGIPKGVYFDDNSTITTSGWSGNNRLRILSPQLELQSFDNIELATGPFGSITTNTPNINLMSSFSTTINSQLVDLQGGVVHVSGGIIQLTGLVYINGVPFQP